MIGRIGKIVLEVAVACIVALAAALLWASYYVDSEGFRLRFTTLVEEALGRPVRLDGGLDIALYPMLSLEVRGLAVAEDPEFGEASLAEIDTVHISARLMPLFSGEVQVESIVVSGLRANVIRSAQGRFNWLAFLEDIGKSEGTGAGAFRIDTVALHEFEVSDASIAYRDAGSGVQFDLGGIDLRTGGIRPGQRVSFVAGSDFSWDDGAVRSKFFLQGMVRPSENWSGFALEDASVSATIGGGILPQGASPGELVARLVVDWDKGVVALEGLHMRFLGLLAEGDLRSADLSQTLGASGKITVHPFVPAEIITRFAPKVPVAKVDGLRRGALSTALTVDGKGFALTDLTLALDDQTLRGDLSVTDFDAPVWAFALRGDTFDLDRYLPLIMTDEPFVWADYPLGFFQGFSGKGTVAMDSFKLFETTTSHVRLALDARAGAIEAEVAGVAPDQVALAAGAHFTIGRDQASGHPTLALRGEVKAESGPAGFKALGSSPVRPQGRSVLVARVETTPLTCPPEVRSIGILRAASGRASLTMGKGRVGLAGRDRKIDYREVAGVEASAAFKARGATTGDAFDFTVTATVQAKGARPGESLTLTLAGPLSMGVDAPRASSPGLTSSGQIAGPIFLERDGAASLAGTLAFDTRASTASLTGGVLTALGTDLRGDIRATDLKGKFKASGVLSLPSADPRRIIRELGGGDIATKDPQALGAASLACRFTLDEEGFTLDDVTAEFDGMPIRAHVVGTGLADPMLTFEFQAGALDIDRYLPPSPTEEERRAGKATRNPPVDLPLNFLRALRLDGQGRFEEFKLGKVRARDFSARVAADKGNIRVHDAKGTVHGGPLTGAISGQVGREALAVQLHLDIRQIDSGPLMVDLGGRDYVVGTGEVLFDLQSSGRTDDDILANLKGAARAQIRNGSFKFTGFDARPAPTSDRSRGQMADDPRTRRTAFRKAWADFAVERGVFRATEFRVEAPPVLQCYGSGWFSLPDDAINLAIRNDFVAVPSLTIEIFGKLSDPEVRIPKDRILNDTVRNILSLPEKSFNFLRDLFK